MTFFDYTDLSDNERRFTTNLSETYREKLISNDSLGVWILGKQAVFETPMCFGINGVRGKGFVGFADDYVDISQLDPDTRAVGLTQEQSTSTTKLVYPLLFSDTGAIVYCEWHDPNVELTVLSQTVPYAHRTLPGLLRLIFQYASSPATKSINVVSREILEFMHFDDIQASAIAHAQAGGGYPLPLDIDRWLWHVFMNIDFDRGSAR
jgi:hypothetical protein